MRIRRATSTNVIPYIEPHIRPADGVSKEQYLENLESWLKNLPETIFLQVGFDGDLVKGFMVAYLPPQVDFIFISQVWSTTRELATQFLIRAMEWGASLQRDQIRMETESDHDNYSDLWNFEPITTTLGLAIDSRSLVGLMLRSKDLDREAREAKDKEWAFCQHLLEQLEASVERHSNEVKLLVSLPSQEDRKTSPTTSEPSSKECSTVATGTTGS